MYSVVLLMALSGGAETPAAHYGCQGACYGGKACHGGYACNGGHGCRGQRACHGCDGGCYGCDGGRRFGHRRNKDCGCCGVQHACYGGVVAPAPPPKKEKKKMPDPKGTGKGEEVLAPAPATIIVSLPADAKLSVDGQATTSTSATRTLVTPALAPDQEFNYTLAGEIVRDGQTVTTSRTITVRAGEETRVTLEFPAASATE